MIYSRIRLVFFGVVFLLSGVCVSAVAEKHSTMPICDTLEQNLDGVVADVGKALPYAALYQAVAADELYTTLDMIEAGAADSERNSEGKNALLLAAEMNMPHVITVLVDRGDNINAQDRFGNSALHLAVTAHDLYTSKMLFEKGIDQGLANEKHYTALHAAAKSADEVLIEGLVSLGMDALASPNPNRFYSPYDIAAESKRWDITALFRAKGYDRGVLVNAAYGDIGAFTEYLETKPDNLEYENRTGNTPIHRATAAGHYELVKFLLDHDVDFRVINIEGEQPFTIAVKKNCKKIFKLFLEYGMAINERDDTHFGNTSLIHAVRGGNLDMINFLLDLGAYIAHPSGVGDTPLHNAVAMNELESARLLLDRGAVVDLKNHAALTPLHMAALNNLTAMAELLIAYGANIDNTDKRLWTPLHVAVDAGHIPMVRFLLANDASASLQDKVGNTPLHLAALKSNFRIATILVRAGASVNAANDAQIIPLHTVVQKGLEKFALYLLNAGADGDILDADGHSSLYIALYNDHY
ncbi:MAG: ankyrin repeat domain-containing protein, partial [Candidatus Hydrogenedentes bacterium]|nr:ankyrin repeat domain-containing protein [Candidatus Hydrogenedentota bacterium]